MTAAWRTALEVLGSDEEMEAEDEGPSATDANERDGACRHAINWRQICTAGIQKLKSHPASDVCS